MSRRLGILGAGAYGTALARLLVHGGAKVSLWAYEEGHAADIAEHHENRSRLPGVRLPKGVLTTANLKEAVTNKEALIFAIPSLYLMDTIRKILGVEDIIEAIPKIAAVTKGFIQGREGPEFILEAMERYLPGAYKGNLVYISGPSHAEELGRDKLTGLISASKNPKNALYFRNLFSRPSVMVFPSLDVIGVQVSAAAKNIISIAFGILDALKDKDPLVGDNTVSLLFSAGLTEIQVLGNAMGATHPETFTSIAGVGDLDVSCRSLYGRNRRFGREIIEKNILEPYENLNDLINRINELDYLPEGVIATRHVSTLASKKGLKLPIIEQVLHILNKEKKPLDIIESFRTIKTRRMIRAVRKIHHGKRSGARESDHYNPPRDA